MDKYSPRQCVFCASEYVPSKLRSRPDRQRFCSVSCARKSNPPKKGTKNGGSFKSGQAPWNKGLNGYMAGRKASDETRRKQSAALMGENSPNWKGGISPINERIRKQRRYFHWRKAVFERDNYTCQFCGDRARKGQRVILHADHIKPFASYPNLRFELSNGRTLCVVCHRKTPTYGAKKYTGKKAELLNG